MIAEPANKLEAEVSRLETLYFVSTILYRREVKAKYREARHSDRPIEFRSTGWRREVAKNAGHFKQIVEELLPRSLRETIFVRLVSALEVFLTDVVREVYAARRDLLETDSHIELSYRYLGSLQTTSELITFLVNKDCRALTSGGFMKATKYFKDRLGIDIASAQSFNTLKEIHERRHLLVHRLGYTDELYRNTYGQHTHRVSIDETFLLESIKSIRDFSAKVVAGADSVISGGPAARLPKTLDEISIDVEVCSPEADRLTSPDFSFLYNERYYSTRDMLVERSVSGPRVKLKLRGEKKVIRVFLRKVQVLAKVKKLVILVPSKTTNAKDVSPATIERVRQALPGGLWDRETAASIAKALGLRSRTVEEALRQLQLSGVGRYAGAIPETSSVATPQNHNNNKSSGPEG
jgi:hypothetical protein